MLVLTVWFVRAWIHPAARNPETAARKTRVVAARVGRGASRSAARAAVLVEAGVVVTIR
jgi:hypothetical protein